MFYTLFTCIPLPLSVLTCIHLSVFGAKHSEPLLPSRLVAEVNVTYTPPRSLTTTRYYVRCNFCYLSSPSLNLLPTLCVSQTA